MSGVTLKERRQEMTPVVATFTRLLWLITPHHLLMFYVRVIGITHFDIFCHSTVICHRFELVSLKSEKFYKKSLFVWGKIHQKID